MQLAQNFFDNIVETLRNQLESSRSLLLEPATKQQEIFQSLTQEWIDAYVKLLNAPLEFYKAGTRGLRTRATEEKGLGAFVPLGL